MYTVSYDAVRRLVGLPMGHMDAWDAKFGRIWPLEPGVTAEFHLHTPLTHTARRPNFGTGALH